MRVVTWNTQWCKGNDGLVSPFRIVDGAKSLGDFDVLCLQEIAVNYATLTGDSPLDQTEALARQLPGFEVVFGPAIDEWVPGQPRRQQFGNLIASRLPILQIEHLALPSPAPVGESHPWMPRLCTVCTIQAPWGPVRVMTTHLEYYSQTQRLVQAQALRRLHQLASGHAANPPLVSDDSQDTPYQTKPHTADTILCGDFNFEPHSDEYRALIDPREAHPLLDGWSIAYPGQAHPPTFRLYDDTYGPEAVSCDFFFVSESLTDRVRQVKVDTLTQASDHQPVMIEID